MLRAATLGRVKAAPPRWAPSPLRPVTELLWSVPQTLAALTGEEAAALGLACVDPLTEPADPTSCRHWGRNSASRPGFCPGGGRAMR